MSYIRILLITLSLVLLVSCTSKEPATKPVVSLSDAQKDCFQQSQSMYNQTIDPASPGSNKYFSNCMQAKYGYNTDEIAKMSMPVQ